MLDKLLENKIPVIFDGELYENILNHPCKLVKVIDEDTLCFTKLTREEYKILTQRFQAHMTRDDFMVFNHIISYNITSQRENFIESKL